MTSKNESVVGVLRRLADDLETGKYSEWQADMTMSRPERELMPMDGECPLDGCRYFAAGDHVSMELSITKGGR